MKDWRKKLDQQKSGRIVQAEFQVKLLGDKLLVCSTSPLLSVTRRRKAPARVTPHCSSSELSWPQLRTRNVLLAPSKLSWMKTQTTSWSPRRPTWRQSGHQSRWRWTGPMWEISIIPSLTTRIAEIQLSPRYQRLRPLLSTSWPKLGSCCQRKKGSRCPVLMSMTGSRRSAVLILGSRHTARKKTIRKMVGIFLTM